MLSFQVKGNVAPEFTGSITKPFRSLPKIPLCHDTQKYLDSDKAAGLLC